MTQFFSDLLEFRFLQFAVMGSVLASFACGIIGSFIVVRRSTYITGAISHSLLAGMGLALFLSRTFHLSWLSPIDGAVLSAVVVSVIITLVQASGTERLDTVLSAVWSVGMALGVTFIAATPGYNQDIMSYLFGNILMVSAQDILFMAVLNGLIVLITWFFYHKFLTISFHRELAELKGIRVNLYEFVFLILTALTIVLMVNVVGIVLVIALLTLPAATAAHFTKRLSTMIIVSCFLTLVYTIGGLMISYIPDWPPGPTMIELAGLCYISTVIWKKLTSSS